MAVKKKLFLFEILFKKIHINADVLLKTFTFDSDTLRRIPVTAKVRFLGQTEFQVNFWAHISRGIEVVALSVGLELCANNVPTVGDGSGEGDSVEEPELKEDECAPSGKSCLFAMDTFTLAEEMKKSPASVEIYTQTEKDMTPVFLGRVKLHFGLHFFDVIISSSRAHDLPVSAFSQSTETLANIFGEECGYIDVYFRISCFGSAIMSDFDFMKPVVEAVETNYESKG